MTDPDTFAKLEREMREVLTPYPATVKLWADRLAALANRRVPDSAYAKAIAEWRETRFHTDNMYGFPADAIYSIESRAAKIAAGEGKA